MKHNLILLLFISVLSFSCSDDDSPNTTNTDNSILLGRWECYKEIIDGETYSPNECERTKLIFLTNNKATRESYMSNFNSGECELYASQDMEWKHLNGSTYRLSLVGMIDMGGDDFTINNNEFIIEYTDGSLDIIEYWRKTE